MFVFTSSIRDAVKSRMLLCRWMGNPSVLQLRACWTSLLLPHAQIVAMPDGCHPYHSASASLNAPLCRVNTCSSIVRVFNHAPAPCSCARATAVIGLLVSQVYRFSSLILFSFNLCGAQLRLSSNGLDQGFGHCYRVGKFLLSELRRDSNA